MILEKNRAFFGGYPLFGAFWSIFTTWGGFPPKNTHFPVPQPGPPVVSQAGTTPGAGAS